MGESEQGRKWIRKHFDNVPMFYDEELESYLNSASAADLEYCCT